MSQSSRYFVFIGQLIRMSARGTIDSALNFGPIIGAAILGAVLSMIGISSMPTILINGWSGVIISTITFSVIAWVFLFIIRFIFYSPYLIWKNDKLKISNLSEELD